jgi:DNA-binding protein HU-beta
MTKSDLVNIIVIKTGIPKAKALESIDALTESIAGALKNGEKITFVDFGTFDVVKRAARIGLNPRTREKISIMPVRAPRFKAGKALKEMVNE